MEVAAAASDSYADGSLCDFFVSRQYETQLVPLCAGAAPQPVDVLPAASTADDLTGQILWPVARATAAYVAGEGLRGARWLCGRACLELGAGCGIVGLVASRWAAALALTDGEDEVLRLLQRNLAHAAPAAVGASSVHGLRWGCAEDEAAMAAAAGRRRWPVLLGADVVYWPAGILPLCATVAALLSPDGVFVLGYNDRLPGNREVLLQGLHARGLLVAVVPLDSFEVIDLPEASRAKITLYRITWCDAAKQALEEEEEEKEKEGRTCAPPTA